MPERSRIVNPRRWGRDWVLRYTPEGFPYRQEKARLPLIPEFCFYCTVHVYSGPEEEQWSGGTGFILAYESRVIAGEAELYIVTAGHVIDDATVPTVRFWRGLGGGAVSLPIPKEHWWPHAEGADIAVAPFNSPREAEWEAVAIEECLTERDAVELGIGPGDDVFMVGRHVDFDGKLENTPSVRFGNISQMPIEVAVDEKGKTTRDHLLVEMRSTPGFSGSPVFVWIPPLSKRPGREHLPALQSYAGPWLIGVDFGHHWQYEPVLELQPGDEEPVRHPSLVVVSHSAMTAVAPVWKLVELVLRTPELKAAREAKEEERRAKKQHGGIALD